MNVNITNSTSLLPPLTDSLYDGLHFLLGSLYFLLAACTLGLLLYKRFRAGEMKELWKIFFFCFIIVASTIRGAWSIVNPLYNNKSIAISNRVDLFLNLYPSLLFFSCYIILLFMWVELFHFTKHKRRGLEIDKTKMFLAVVLIAMHVVYLILFVVDVALFDSNWTFAEAPVNITEKLMVLYLAFLYLLSTVLFCVYGILIVLHLRSTQDIVEVAHLITPGGDSEFIAKKMKRVLWRSLLLTSVIVCAFLVRAVLVFVSFFFNWEAVRFFDLVYFTCLEIIPVSLMLIILQTKSKKKTPTRDN